MSDSFPCLVCGGALARVADFEGQPNDGLMCQSNGNYGSTVFDPFDLSYLAFNICDACMVTASELGRVMVTRDYALVMVEGFGPVGRIKADRPYVPWSPDIADDGATVTMSVEELRTYAHKIDFRFSIDAIEEHLKEHENG